MRKPIAALSLAIFFSAVSLAVFAQTELSPGQTTFTVAPLVLFDVSPQPEDYCGNPEKIETLFGGLGLRGTNDTFNVRWDAVDPSGEVHDIIVNCYLNCPVEDEDDIGTICAGYQTCSYIGPTGAHSCTIENPEYLLDSGNEVTCKFVDARDPDEQLRPYPSRTFFVLDFRATAPQVSTIVGDSFSLPITVQNLGLFRENYTVNVTALQKQSLILFDRNILYTDKLFCGQIGTVFPSVTMLAADSIPLTVQTHQTADPNSCTTDSDCSYLDSPNFAAKCAENVCWKRYDVQITAGQSSLPEFDMLGFLAIIFSAFGAFIFVHRKR